MAIVTLTPQTMDKDGAAPTYTAIDATDTYSFRNGEKTILHFLNTGTESTVTLDTPGTVGGGLAIENPTVTVPATTGDIMVALDPLSAFNDSSGNATFTQDVASGVTVAVVQR